MLFSAGDILPSELELEKIFGTSRAPVRQALGMLENEGLIVRQPGKGTFVAELSEEVQLWSSPFRQYLRKNRDKIWCKTLSVKKISPEAEILEFLLLGKTQKALLIERLRSIDDRPVIYTRHYLHPSFSVSKIRESGDFYSIKAMLMEKFSVEVTQMEDSLKAVSLPADAAYHLQVPEGIPALEGRRASSSEKKPVHFDVFYTLSDIWSYQVTFKKGTRGGARVA